MQEYTDLSPTGYVNEDRATINKNFQSIISDFSGTAFPTENLVEGMRCNRTDQSKIYRLKNVETQEWAEIYNYSEGVEAVPKAISATNAENATNATNAENAKSAEKATNDGNGKNIAATYVSGVTQNEQMEVVVKKGDGTSSKFKAGDVTQSGLGVRENNETINVGDVRFLYGRDNAGIAIRYIQAGTTASTEPTFNLDGTETIDGTAKAIAMKTPFFLNSDYVGKIEFTFDKTIPAGKIPAFGTLYSRTTYNKLWEHLQQNPQKVLTETAWQEFYNAHNGQVPYYSDGDSSTTFRVPRLTGFAEGAGSLDEVGTWLPEKNSSPNVSKFWIKRSHRDWIDAGNGSWFFGFVDSDGGYSAPMPQGDDETRPASILGMWVITAFVAVTGISSTTLDNIASGLTETETRIGELENSFAIIPVNNGEDITINSRYIEENPFKGYYVTCEVQVQYKDKWSAVQGFIYSSGGYGVTSGQLLPDDSIIVQTGQNYLLTSSISDGNLFGDTTSAINLKTAPCRVIVYKLGKIGE